MQLWVFLSNVRCESSDMIKILRFRRGMRVKCCDKNEQSSVQKIDSKLFQSELIHSRVQEKLNWFHITIIPHKQQLITNVKYLIITEPHHFLNSTLISGFMGFFAHIYTL